MRPAALTVPGSCWTRADTRPSRSCRAPSASRPSIAPLSSSAVQRIRRQALAEAELVDTLRVVVLIPEDREHHHRLAEVEALGGRVVAAVRDDEIDLRQDRRLREELRAPHVVGELEQLVLRPLGHDEPVRTVREDRDQALHQLEVGGGEAAEAQVDELPVAARQRAGNRPRVVRRANRAFQTVPGRRERSAARIVGLGRIDVEVQIRRLVHELELAAARGAPLSCTKASKSCHMSSCVRRYSASNSLHPSRSAVG